MQTLKHKHAYPQRIIDHYSEPMWKSLDGGKFIIQSCCNCGVKRYPPAPVCPDCLSNESEWIEPTGRGEIISWVVFHRQYLDAYPIPYNVVAVKLEEGPIIISNLIGDEPKGTWIGKNVTITIVYDTQDVGLPKVRIGQ